MSFLPFVDSGIEDRAVAIADDATGEWSTIGKRLHAEDVAHAVISGMRDRLALLGVAPPRWGYVVTCGAGVERDMRSRLTE